MAEFFRGLVLPDILSPQPSDLLSLLLVWDELEVQSYPEEETNTFRQELRTNELIREYPAPLEFDVIADNSGASDEEHAKHNGESLAAGVMEVVQRSLADARDKGLAPLATTRFAELAAALPASEGSAPIIEATLIQVVTRGIRVGPETSLEDILAFRDRNQRLMGRFRGAMADLAAAIGPDTLNNPAEEAHAIVRNRVEPAIGDLTDALERNRISYAVRVLLGATSVSLASASAATASLAGGVVASRSLRYAFDRDRLVNDHPFGLVYRVSQEFGQPLASRRGAIIDPEEKVREECIAAWQGVMSWLRREMKSDSEAP